MDTVVFFVKGLVVGLVIAAPVGPVGVLCVRRTLAYGPAVGLLSGLGAAAADAFYGFVAAFGVTFVSDFLIGHGVAFRLVGGVILLGLAIKTFRAAPAHESGPPQATTLVSALGSTFVLTLTNPITIMAFAAIFAGLGLAGASAGYAAASVLVLGVFLGSAVWWLGLSGAVGVFRASIEPNSLRWVNRISAALIAAFGITALISGLSMAG